MQQLNCISSDVAPGAAAGVRCFDLGPAVRQTFFHRYVNGDGLLFC